MILNTIQDYFKHKLFIPVFEESVMLDKAILKYNKLKKVRKAVTAKNEHDIEEAFTNVQYQMKRLQKSLKKRGLWG